MFCFNFVKVVCGNGSLWSYDVSYSHWICDMLLSQKVTRKNNFDSFSFLIFLFFRSHFFTHTKINSNRTHDDYKKLWPYQRPNFWNEAKIVIFFLNYILTFNIRHPHEIEVDKINLSSRQFTTLEKKFPPCSN